MDYKHIKTDYILSSMDNDASMISTIVDLFKEQVEETNSKMKELLESKDYYNLGLLAHKIKSSAAILGMDELVVMLKKFELQAKISEEIEKYPQYVERFGIETDAAITELNHFLDTLNSK